MSEQSETCMCGESEANHSTVDPPHMFYAQARYDESAEEREALEEIGLGRREADCGCCFIVDKIGLRELSYLAGMTTSAPTTDANDPSAQEGLAGVLRSHVEEPCAEHTPAVNAWWSQCEGCDWKGPRRSNRASREHDHRAHLAEAILRAGFGPVRAIEAERDFFRAESDEWKQQADINLYRKRAESATAAHEEAEQHIVQLTESRDRAERAHEALVAGIEGLASRWDAALNMEEIYMHHAADELRALIAEVTR